MNVVIITDSQTRNIKPEAGTYVAYHRENGKVKESPEPSNPTFYGVPFEFDVIQIVLGGWTIAAGWTSEIQEIVYKQCQQRNWEPYAIDAVFILGGLNDVRGNLLQNRTTEEAQKIRNKLLRDLEILAEKIEMKLSYRARVIYLGSGRIWGSSSRYQSAINSDVLIERFCDFTVFNYEVCQRSTIWRLKNKNLEYRSVFLYYGDEDIRDEIGHPSPSGRKKIANEIEELLIMIAP